MQVVLVLLLCYVNVAVRGVEEVLWWASRFYWWYKRNMRVKVVMLISHGDARTARLPYYEVGLEFSRIRNEFLVDYH